MINNKPGVSEKTRKRVLRLIKEMDYRPNQAAQMLTTQRSNTLELIVVDVFYAGRLADSTKNMVTVCSLARPTVTAWALRWTMPPLGWLTAS